MKSYTSKSSKIVINMFLIMFLFLSTGLSTSAGTQPASTPPSGADATALSTQATERVVVRLYYDNRTHLDAVAGSIDIWEVNPDGQYVVASMTPAHQDWLEVLGYRVEIDAERTAKVNAPAAPLDPRFYYFDNDYINPNGRYVVDFLQDTNAAYPDLTELIDIGEGWQASHGGHQRDIWVLRISNEDPAYGDILDKPPFFLFGTIHAREVAIPELAIRYIKYLTSGYNGEGGYGLDADATWLVNHNVVYVLVMQNPDGHRINEANTSAYRRKNMDNDDGCTDPGSWGVDLNRNHSFLWGCCGGSSPSPCDDTYRGPTRGGEPETQAFQSYFASVFQDWNGPNGDDEVPPAAPDDAMGIFISLHSYSDLVLWAYDLPGYGQSPNYAQMQTIGRKFAYYNGYDPSGSIWYTVDGATDYWTYGKFGVPSFTFEVGSGGSCGDFFPQYGCIDGIDGMPRSFWAENKPAFLYAHKLARTPYLTTYGPDTDNPAVTPDVIYQGLPVELSATIADHRYGGDPLQPVMAAEYFIDSPGVDGTGTSMDPADGAWGETNEGIIATLDTSSLSVGQHYILMHGQNDDGNWGPFSAVFLTVEQGDYLVGLSPEADSLSGDAGQPVTYTLQLNNIGLNADTYTVTVDSLWSIAAPTTLGPLDPATGITFTVQVNIPISATHGESDIALVSVTSQAQPDITDSSTLTTQALQHGLEVQPTTDSRSGDPGQTIVYSLQVTNTGDTTDTFTVSLGEHAWQTEAPASLVPLDPGGSLTFPVTVTIAPEAAAGAQDQVTVTVSTDKPGFVPGLIELTTQANTIYALDLSSSNPSQVAHAPGAVVNYTLVVTNTGNIVDTFVTAVTSEWDVDAPGMIGPLAPGESDTVTLRVHVPTNAVSGDVNTTLVRFASLGDLDVYLQVNLSTSTLWYNTYLPLLKR